MLKPRFGIAAICGLLFVGLSGPVSGQSCPELPGADELIAADSTRFVIVGDYHGTNEVPALVGDLVCRSLAAGRSVNLALEWPTAAQSVVDRYLVAPDTEADLGEVFRALGEPTDGRGSVAMLNLLAAARAWRTDGRSVRVTLMLPVDSATGSRHEELMAFLLQEGARLRPEDLTIALVGNVHAMKAGDPRIPGLTPMAALLPQDATLSINTGSYTGEAWNCRRPSGSDRDLCQIWPLGAAQPAAREIKIAPEAGGRFDGRYSVGPFTASRPLGSE